MRKLALTRFGRFSFLVEAFRSLWANINEKAFTFEDDIYYVSNIVVYDTVSDNFIS